MAISVKMRQFLSYNAHVTIQLNMTNQALVPTFEQVLHNFALPYHLDQPTPGDGNCYFHAILQQLHHYNDTTYSSHTQIRHELVSFVAKLYERTLREPNEADNASVSSVIKAYIHTQMHDQETDEQTWHRLLTEMATENTWVQDIFISLTCQFLERSVFITSHTQSRQHPWLKFPFTSSNGQYKTPITLIMIPQVHFQSILPVVSPQETNTLEYRCLGCGKTSTTSIKYHFRFSPTCKFFYNLDLLNTQLKAIHTKNKNAKLAQKRQTSHENIPNPPKKAKKTNDAGNAIQRREKFKRMILYGPIFPCLSCHRLMFEDGVHTISKPEAHKAMGSLIRLYNKSDTYNSTTTDKFYICTTCRRYLAKDKPPPLCYLNELETETVPIEMKLNELGATLIAKNIIFLKLFKLPKSRWTALKDKIVNVPIEDNDLISTLSKINAFPRTITQSGIIPVSLKRKVSMKNTVLSAFVDPLQMTQALKYLKSVGHPGYQDITITMPNEHVSADANISQDASSSENETTTNERENKTIHVHDASPNQESDNVEQVTEAEIDTAEHPDQPSVLINNYPEINLIPEAAIAPASSNTTQQPNVRNPSSVSLAPGEGKIPTNIMRDENWDINAFPLLFPSGQFGLNQTRPVHISTQNFFLQRLLNKNQQFVNYPPWLFSALYYLERQQLEQQININYRKGKFIDNNILQIDDGFDVFSKISGTPKYWQQKRFEMIARLEQLGPFQFFFTLSCADKRWTEILASILHLKGETVTYKQDNGTTEIYINDIPIKDYLSTIDTHLLIKENLLTLTRCFDKRIHAFLKHIILAKDSPLPIKFYNYRVEFQLRGAGHVHGVLWLDFDALQDDFKTIKSAFHHLRFNKKLTPQAEAILTKFTDDFITCSLDTEIKEIVQKVQTHSHSNSCRKYNTTCRFDYPKFPTDKTIVAHKLERSDFKTEQEYMEMKQQHTKTLKQVKEALISLGDTDLETTSIQQILQAASVSSESYYSALKCYSHGTSLILKRKVNEIYINNYNTEWLSSWNANMDLQICLDYFSVLTYITDYYTKQDTGCLKYLKEAAQQCKTKSLKDKMHCLTQAFLCNRQIGESEAYYRIIPNLHLTDSNIRCIFIPTGFPSNRSRFLLKLTEENSQSYKTVPKEEYISVQHKTGQFLLKESIQEKYMVRPTYMETTTLASFASNYEKVSKNTKISQKQKELLDSMETCNTDIVPPIIQLQDRNKTLMRKRQYPLVLRYHKHRPDTQIHEHMYSELLLFTPWRTENSLHEKDFTACYNLYNSLLAKIQHEKEAIFPHKNNIDAAREIMSESDPHSNHISTELDAENTQDNLDNNMTNIQLDDTYSHLDTDFITSKEQTSIDRSKYRKMDHSNVQKMTESVQQLNKEQRFAFDRIIHYCKGIIKVRNGAPTPPKPPLLMIHGGAGTGKSKLIKDISQWAEHLLTTANNQSLTQPFVLRVAPTGKAASLIEGLTLHSAFNFNFNNDFFSLSDKSRDHLRTELQYFTILIIDEISMVKADLLYQLNLRLQEIKQNTHIFGGISVLLFGDLMQLKPIQARWIYEEPASPKFQEAFQIQNLWQEFQIIELTKNHRQGEDAIYAQILNNVRFGRQTHTDLKTLHTRLTTNPPRESLHVFGRNKQVNAHNKFMFESNENIGHTFQAIHMHPTIKVYKPYIKESGHIGSTAFIDKLQLKLDSKVMLINNMDTADFLTNGCMGIVRGFRTNKDKQIEHILIHFDHEDIGYNYRIENTHLLKNNQKHLTPIPRISFQYSIGSASKNHACNLKLYQFPLQLAHAITAHKIQGQTITKPNSLVADLATLFEPGQAYVILSRVQCLRQLHLTSINEKQIKFNEKSKREADAMVLRSITTKPNPWTMFSPDNIKITCLNIRSLNNHYQDLANDHTILHSHFICLTETHLKPNTNIPIPNYNLIQASIGKGKGVAIYTHKKMPTYTSLHTEVHSEYQYITLTFTHFTVTVLYRSSGNESNSIDIANSLKQHIDLRLLSFVCGDINIQYNKNKLNIFTKQLEKMGLQQHIQHATHEKGNIIDHLYTTPNKMIMHFLHSVYYSDHDAICAVLQI